MLLPPEHDLHVCYRAEYRGLRHSDLALRRKGFGSEESNSLTNYIMTSVRRGESTSQIQKMV